MNARYTDGITPLIKAVNLIKASEDKVIKKKWLTGTYSLSSLFHVFH